MTVVLLSIVIAPQTTQRTNISSGHYLCEWKINFASDCSKKRKFAPESFLEEKKILLCSSIECNGFQIC
jgi:hypothetical protein